MKKIIGILRPFNLEQSFYVFEDGNKIDSAELTIDEINDFIFNLIDKYNIHQIDLSGPKQYSKGIAEKIKQAEVTKYNKNSITINLI